jgi:hypothetical protein
VCAELAFGTPTLFFELLDAVTIPAAQPASLPELRVNAAAGRERLVMKQPRRATAVLGVLLALLRCVIGPAVPAPLTAAIVNGQNFRDSSTRIIGIAPLAAVAADTSHCSSASPCWLCPSEKIEVLDGGAQLASIDSIKLLGYYTSGKGSESMCPADESQEMLLSHVPLIASAEDNLALTKAAAEPLAPLSKRAAGIFLPVLRLLEPLRRRPRPRRYPRECDSSPGVAARRALLLAPSGRVEARRGGFGSAR